MLNEIIQHYSQLTKDCNINNIYEKFSYYYAEELKTSILISNCLDIDIISAYPNICKLIYYKKFPKFIDQIQQKIQKKERNIFIATFLAEQGQNDNFDYLHELNIYCKIFVLSYIYNNYKNIEILEYKKDGVLFTSTIKQFYEINQDLNIFFKKNNISFHIKNIDLYAYYNKTSIYVINKKIFFKGKLKEPSSFLYDNIFNLIIKKEIYNNDFLDNIKQLYSPLFLKILYKNNMFHLIHKYYSFQKNKFLTFSGQLTTSINEIDTYQILKQFIYPILYLLRNK